MWILVGILTIGMVGWLTASCGSDRADAERPVNDTEAQLLAGLRYRNFTDEPVAVQMRIPTGSEELTVGGYVDWGVPLLYARLPGAEGADQLVQAMPGIVATHADDESFDSLDAPEDGWTARQMLAGSAGQPDQTVFDILVSSLFTLSADQDDSAEYLLDRATWREDSVIDGEPVDVFRAPIMVGADRSDGAASPEALYSLDGDGEIRRFQVNTGATGLATIDFLRDVDFDAEALRPIDMLGGPVVDPGPVDADLAATIAEVRHANWSQSATVELSVPTGDGAVLEGHGYIDWRTMLAYLNVADADGNRLVLARPGGLATLPVEDDELPERLPSEGWETRSLEEAETAESFGPLEMLTYRLLEMSAEEPDDAERVAEEASRLRVDEGEDDEPTYVVEFPVVGDAGVPAGEAAFRYHISGERLREVEMTTFHGIASAAIAYDDFELFAIPWSVSEAIG